MSLPVIIGRSIDFRFAGQPLGDRSIYIPGAWRGFRLAHELRTRVRVAGLVGHEDADLALHPPSSVRQRHPELAALSDDELAHLLDRSVDIELGASGLVARNRSGAGRHVYVGSAAGKTSGLRGRRLAPGRATPVSPGDFLGFAVIGGKLCFYLLVHLAGAEAELPGGVSAVGNSTDGLGRSSPKLDAATVLVKDAPAAVDIHLRRTRGGG